MERNADVIVAGHICLDVIPAFGARETGLKALMEPGKLVDVGPAVTATGGAVSNTGLALHKLGVKTRLMGKVGGDLFGRAILGALHGVDPLLAEGMIVVPDETSSYSIVINPPGVDRMFLHCTGANDTFAAGDIRWDLLDAASLFHFGYPPLMKNMYEDGGDNLRKLFAGVKRKGLTASLDLARPDPESPAGRADWRTILSKALPYVDVFLPSLEEIYYVLDRSGYEERLAECGGSGEEMLAGIDGATLNRLSGELLAMGTAVVAIKLGEHGLYVRTTERPERLREMGRCAPAEPGGWLGRELLAPCFEVEVAGTTGAGDCTIAGFLAGMLSGGALEDAAIAAVAVGACNVEKADSTSGIVPWKRVASRIQAGWPQRLNRLRLDGWIRDEERKVWRGPDDGRGSAC